MTDTVEEYHYLLPNIDGEVCHNITKTNSVILIGANGSGKSRLGSWMEEKKPNDVHRVAAQRMLRFTDYIEPKNFEQSINLLVYGSETGNNKGSKWGWNDTGNSIDYTKDILDDYNLVLSSVLGLENQQNVLFVEQCKIAEKEGVEYPKVPKTIVDDLKDIWDNIFPQRKINFENGKITATYTSCEEQSEYKGTHMSSGEKVVLYLISQCLCIPNSKTIIIDEPELHLHKSIMNKLWSQIEKRRRDCLFIYMTHDTQFAANHSSEDKIWIKNHDGVNWEIQKIKDTELPEDLLLEILGNRKNILFVEGESNSYDTRLYRILYPEFYIIPVNSCNNVIRNTISIKSNSQLHHLKVLGLIDRDYRNSPEIESLNRNGINVLQVSEVENLFLVEEVLKIIEESRRIENKVEEVKEYIINTKFKNMKHQQKKEYYISEIKYNIEIMGLGEIDFSKIDEHLLEEIEKISEKIKLEAEEIFNDENIKYKEVLKVFNRKDLIYEIGSFFELSKGKYVEEVFRLLEDSEYQDRLIEAFKLYIPEFNL